MKHSFWHIDSAQKVIIMGAIFWYLTSYMGWALPYIKRVLLWFWRGGLVLLRPIHCSVALTEGIKVPPFVVTHFSLNGSICLNHIHEPVVRVYSILWGGPTSSPTVCPDMRATFSCDTRDLGTALHQIHPRSRSKLWVFPFLRVHPPHAKPPRYSL